MSTSRSTDPEDLPNVRLIWVPSGSNFHMSLIVAKIPGLGRGEKGGGRGRRQGLIGTGANNIQSSFHEQPVSLHTNIKPNLARLCG